ncbi:MAG: sigma-54-dependent Fis family transcriptional regulator [Desulfobacteraceae bacterium]|nr:MAG: sigma-54-dependent Fis family transcriptional regulator [Desulfobacteraceae bacterium]
MEYPFIGNAPSICKIRELIKLVSDTAFSVLISGETGTGKEVVARLLHSASSRRRERFIKVNCAALPLTLLESELFGYEKGAFTGADRSKPGKFELASDGVIFLDEIGDMPLLLQAKLLEVIQCGKFVRLGGTTEISVNTWVISSTNHNLQEDIRESLFREDLYYRLNVINIQIPPLRERREDIGLLANHFLERYGGELNLPESSSFPHEMNRMFMTYPWPGNVRELSSTVLRYLIGEPPEVICSEMDAAMKEERFSPPDETEKTFGNGDMAGSPTLLEIKARATKNIEKQAILQALKNAGWKKRAAARMLRISHKALYYKMEDLGIGRKEEGAGSRNEEAE